MRIAARAHHVRTWHSPITEQQRPLRLGFPLHPAQRGHVCKATSTTQLVKPVQLQTDGFGVTSQELVDLVDTGFRSSGYVDTDASDLAGRLRTKLLSGLDAENLELRSQLFGTNRLPPPKVVSFWGLVVEAMQVRRGQAMHGC